MAKLQIGAQVLGTTVFPSFGLSASKFPLDPDFLDRNP